MEKLKLVIPKGRIYDKVNELLKESGIILREVERSYRPIVNNDNIEVKILKPQNIPKLIELGRHDIGFAGLDWIVETNSDVVKVMDLNFDAVKIISAIPDDIDINEIKNRKIIVTSEYENITKTYLNEKNYNYIFVKSFGATEVFPPEDADMIVDNTSTGKTLKDNKLKIIDTIMESSTQFIANKNAIEDPDKNSIILEMKLMFESVLNAKLKVMLEMNVPSDKFETIINMLPCMRSPTISKLYGEEGYSIKVVVNKDIIHKLIPQVKSAGAVDILEYNISKVVS